MSRGRVPEISVALVCAGYVVVLALQYADIIGAMNWNSDSASGFTMASTLSQGGDHGWVIMATSGQYVSLWFGLLTASLPLHREVWELAPYAAYVVTCAIVVVAVWRVAPGRAAWLATAILLPASPLLLWFVVRGVVHTAAYLGTAVAGAFLVWLWQTEPLVKPRALAISAFAAIALGVLTASDPLLLVTGLAPFAVAIVAGGSRRRAVWAGCTLVGAGVAAAITTALGGWVQTVAPSPAIASLDTWDNHFTALVEGLVRLAHGAGIGTSVPLWRVVLAAGLLGVGVVVAAIVVARGLREAEPARRVHLVYWAASAALAAAAFVCSTQANIGTYQYFLTIVFALAATVPLAGSRRWLGAGMLAASLLAVTNAVGVAQGGVQDVVRSKIMVQGGALEKAAEAAGVTRGYAGYWNASSLTWNSHETLSVRPVQTCPNPHGADLCPFGLMSIGAWYRPQDGRTFLIVDPSTVHVPVVPRGLGPPLASYPVGTMTLLIYPYDIASKLGPLPE